MPRPSSPPFLGRTWSRGLWRRSTRGTRETLARSASSLEPDGVGSADPRGVSRGIERGRDADARARPRTRVCRGRRTQSSRHARGRRRDDDGAGRGGRPLGRRLRGRALGRLDAPRDEHGDDADAGEDRVDRARRRTRRPPFADCGGGRLRRRGTPAALHEEPAHRCRKTPPPRGRVRAARRGPRTPPARSRRPFEAPRRFRRGRARGETRAGGPIRRDDGWRPTTLRRVRTTTPPPAAAPRFRETREETR